ncbi:MAG: amidohydrolase family protein [Gemmatimonadetes bacterium]|nr:amidohydrolase family protein [Gemmatimonadota bacterium]
MLIRGGRVVNADGVVTADVRIVGEQITEVGRNLTPGAGARVIEANGMLLMPGGIDPHTHLHPSFADDLTSGTQAALAGGITTVGTFSTPRRDGDHRRCARPDGRDGAGGGHRRRHPALVGLAPKRRVARRAPVARRTRPAEHQVLHGAPRLRRADGAGHQDARGRAHSASSRWCTARTARCSTRRCVA